MQALSGLSGLSGVVSAAGPPAAPAGLTVTPNASDSTQMSVSWTAAVGALTYDLQRSTDNATWSTVSAAQAGTTFGDTGLSGLTLYYYRVRSTNTGGSSAYSASASATTAYSPASDANLLGWWQPEYGAYQDAAKTVPATTTGQTVQDLTDKSGNGYDLAIGLDATMQQPTLLLAAVNGKPALHFAGDTWRRLMTPAFGTPLAFPYTLFIIARVNTDKNYGRVCGTGSAADGSYLGIDGDATKNVYLYNGSVASIFTDDNAFHQYLVQWNGATSLVNLDGNVQQSLNPGVTVTTLKSLMIGSTPDAAVYLAGDVAEVFLLSGGLTNPKLAAVIAYGRGRYATY